MLTLAVLTGLLLGMSISVQAKENTIESGVKIGNIDVSGMTEAEVKSRIHGFIASLEDVNITLQYSPDKEVVVTAGDIGICWENEDVLEQAMSLGKQGNVVQRYKAMTDLQRNGQYYPLELGIDRAAVSSILTEQCAVYDQEAISASLSRVDGTFQIQEGQTGYVLNVEASADAISSYLQNNWNYEDSTIALVVDIDQPKGDAEVLAKVKDVLGTYTTAYKTSGPSRCTNVATGCNHLNGITLYPGEQVSVLEEITPFSEANGYMMAGSYLNGQVVESLGGGICQVSTTLYNAVLRAELQVDERSNHSMIISYVEPSQDAAIAESSGKDFKFTNNTEYPIYIEGYTTSDKTITFTIYGVETRPENRVVEYESEILEKNVPEVENIIQDPSQPIGYVSVQSVHIGYKARLWKIVKEDGVQVSREQINSSNYKAVPRTATVGTATSNPDAYNQLQAAIATGVIDHVKAVAGALAAQEQAQQQVIMEDNGNGATDG